MNTTDDLRRARDAALAAVPADPTARLLALRSEVRRLAADQPLFEEACRAAFDRYLDLSARYRAALDARRDRELALARTELERGRLSDPAALTGLPCLPIRIDGLCPMSLAGEVGQYAETPLPAKLERRYARAALKAMERQRIINNPDTSEDRRASMREEDAASFRRMTMIPYKWTVQVQRPTDWDEPPNPHIASTYNLSRFSDTDYMTIALHRLGGLADAGAVRPIVPKPEETGTLESHKVYLAWRSRLPIGEGTLSSGSPELDARELPPEIAEQMLVHVRRWLAETRALGAREDDASTPLEKEINEPRGSECGEGEAGLQDQARADDSLSAVDAKPPPEWRPARWFRDQYGIQSSRLRAAKKRGALRSRMVDIPDKTKRIEYSVPDAKRLWEDDFS